MEPRLWLTYLSRSDQLLAYAVHARSPLQIPSKRMLAAGLPFRDGSVCFAIIPGYAQLRRRAEGKARYGRSAYDERLYLPATAGALRPGR